MDRYCRCGYSVLVTVTWDGHDYHLVLRDGTRGKASSPITHCPQCGYGLALDTLRVQPRPDAQWRPDGWREGGGQRWMTPPSKRIAMRLTGSEVRRSAAHTHPWARQSDRQAGAGSPTAMGVVQEPEGGRA